MARTPVHLRTLVASTLVAFVVSAAMSSSATLPPASKPSDHDRLVALIKRTNKLQSQLAETRSIALEADAGAGDAQSITSCINTAAQLIERADGTIVSAAAGDLPDDTNAFIVPTLDDSCVAS